jgi:hypothetical protein
MSKQEKSLPSFNAIFNDRLPTDAPLNVQWAKILELEQGCYLDVNFDESNNPIIPSLSDKVKICQKPKNMPKPMN